MNDMKTYLKNPVRFTKKEYENVEFRWWKFWSWFGTATYSQRTLSPITIQVRMKKVFIHADPIGHELVKNCGMWDD